MQGHIKKDNSSGTVRLQGDKVFWDDDNQNILQFDTNEIVIIGEYTNADGPYFDDWFLTFVTKDGQWLSISFYANDIDKLLQYLTDKFHVDFAKTCLANSTEWSSVIRYPKHLKDKSLFTLTPSSTYKIPKTYLDKIKSSVGFGNFDTTQNISLTNEVKSELTNASR